MINTNNYDLGMYAQIMTYIHDERKIMVVFAGDMVQLTTTLV